MEARGEDRPKPSLSTKLRGWLTHLLCVLLLLQGPPLEASEGILSIRLHPEQSKDYAGQITSFTYDDTGRLLKTTYPDATVTENIYDDADRLEVVIDARGKSATFEHDAGGRRKKTIDALGFVTEFGYDTAGNQTSVKDAAGNVTAFVYDSLGRQVRVVYPDGTDIRTTYDVLSRRIAETDQAGKITRFGYDKLGRLESVTDALNQVTRYGYDDLGNRISQKDANGNVTTFEYDSAGRQTRRTLPGGALERFTYDAGGNLKSRTDFKGVTTLYDYDDLNRLEKRSYPGSEPITFTYTATGRRHTAVDARGTTTYDYDDRDRIEALTYPDGRQLSYAYDDNGNRRELKATVGAVTLTTAYTHDDLNRLQTVTDPEGGVTVHGYDPNGNRASLGHPNGVVTTYTYDPLNRLKNLTAVSAAGAPITSFSYTLGATGNRTKIVELDGTTKNYVYDDLYRLTSEVVTLGTAPRWSNSFSYDPVGNRKAQNRVEIGGATRSVGYTYDSRDRLQTEDSVHYGWDPNGNLISKSGPDGATYEWDFENRLKKVTLTGRTTAEHTYDVDGTRVRTVTTPASGPAQAVDYLVDTSGALSHVVVEGTSERPVAAYYVRGDDLLSVIRPAEGEPAVVRNYHADGLGSIRALTDAGGEITDTWQFEAFGSVVGELEQEVKSYLFAAESIDISSGLYYSRVRWLDPEVGRFTAMDLLPGMLIFSKPLHPYAYVSSDPINKIDPTGLSEMTLSGQLVLMQVRLTTVFRTQAVAVVGAVAATCAAIRVIAGTTNILDSSFLPSHLKKCAPGEFLVRFGPEPETAEELGNRAAEALARGFPHGVSTVLRNRISGTDLGHRSAKKADVEKFFQAPQTGSNKKHHTVVLPKPVTGEVASIFNFLFIRRK